MLMADRTVRKIPHARIEINTPYYVGNVEGVCLIDALYDLLIGNIEGAQEPSNPDRMWNIINRVANIEDQKKENVNQVDSKLKFSVENKSPENEQKSHEENISKNEKEISNLCSISRSEFRCNKQRDWKINLREK